MLFPDKSIGVAAELFGFSIFILQTVVLYTPESYSGMYVSSTRYQLLGLVCLGKLP